MDHAGVGISDLEQVVRGRGTGSNAAVDHLLRPAIQILSWLHGSTAKSGQFLEAIVKGPGMRLWPDIVEYLHSRSVQCVVWSLRLGLPEAVFDSELNKGSSTIGLLIKRLCDKLKAAGLSCISAEDKETLTGR